MLGNIKFIGELGKLELLHESILHRCIKTLLDKKKRVALKEIGEDLECLCQILRTVGPQLDHDKARLLMDQYFERMRALMVNKELPSRIRFLLQDTVELRGNAWQPRKAFSDNGPKLISQIRQEAVKDLGVYIPSPYSSSNHRSDLFPDDPFVLWGGAMGGMARRPQYSLGGLSDVFSQMGRELGTGPGVIQSRYSPPMGRHRTGQLFNGYGSHTNAGPAQFGDKGFSRQLGPGLFNLPGPPIPGSSKELPNRFGKKGALNLDEISLRPAQSFLLSRNQTPKLQPQIPTMMPPSAQPPRTQTPPSQAPSLGLKSAPPPIQEKPPKKEKKVPTREELLKLTDGLIEELYGEGNVEAATAGLKELPAPRPLLPELLAHILASSLERPDEERERACVLLETLHKDEVINGELFVKAFSALLDHCGELESTVPQVKSCAAQLAARAVASGLVGLAEAAGPLENGQHFPLLLLCLQQLARLRDPDWLADTFQASRINMTKMLPECDQSAERMVEILEEKGLAFLFPLLHVERELSRHLESDPSPPAFYKWVKENVSARLHGDRAFINILVTCLLHFITGETSLADGFDPTIAPNRDVMEREKQLLDSFQPVLCRFLHGRVPLQLSALYALQVHCHRHCFPKGMLLRWFIALYDLEVVEEEAFLAWKEDLAEEFPGKGKALFQVNQWLTWLETAEEDESEEEDDDADG
uniref:eukaryotic translation initiation factor 4 gamma 2 n=1 Tax=Myxine glutinosa TaxID=7769 RepID=UPI00358EC28C